MRIARGLGDRTRALALALVFAGCTSDSLDHPELADPSPFHPARELRIETGSVLDTVPVTVPVNLVFEQGGFVQYLWTLVPPPGSAAVLSDPASPTPSFTPDIEGQYEVIVATMVGPTPVEQSRRKLTAATYVGQASCATCHGERVTATAATTHGTTLEMRAAELFATPGCLNCHVLGSYAGSTVKAPGGFDDEAENVGFDPATYVFTDYATFAADFPSLPNLGSVQCESCHGPGSLHRSDPRRTEVSTSAELCGSCHNTFGPRFKQWELSVHWPPPPPPAIDDPDCARCHTARAFARDLAQRPARAEGSAAPGVTCAACHDPHSNANDSQVRIFGDVPLSDGTLVPAGRAAACVTCHRTEILDPALHADQGRPFPFAVQAEMVYGRGAIEVGPDPYGSSFHGDDGMKLRNFTGDPDDPLYAEACVTCHMAPTPTSGPHEDRVGAHAMRLTDGDFELALGNCDRCHAGLDTFDRNLGHDYDGNGTADGVQTEVSGLIENLYTALDAADTGGGLSRPGGPGTPIEVATDLSLTTAPLREAAFNYNFVVKDGSLGVHNTVYAVQLLQRTYGSVTGVGYTTAFPMAFAP
jgi:hypothetical protein